MPLTTYAELKATMANFLNRQDLTAIIPTFIELAEAEMRRDLFVRGNLIEAVATISMESDTLPADLQQLVNIRVNAANYGPMIRLEPHLFDLKRLDGATGTPSYYTTVGYLLSFYPAPVPPGVEILITYYEKIRALSDTAIDNFVLRDWPDLYLYGSLKHSAPYLLDDGRIALWDALYQKAKEAVLVANERAEFGATPLTIRQARVFGGVQVEQPIS